MFGQYTCLGSQCPPPNPHNIVPQFYPPIPELVSKAPPEPDKAEAYSKQKNAEIRQKLQGLISQAAGNPIQSELQSIFDSLMEVYNWTLEVKPPYPESAALHAHRLAEKQMDEAWKAAPLTPDVEEAILEQTLPIPEPEPSFVRRNAVPLFVGGGVLIFGIIGLILMIRV